MVNMSDNLLVKTFARLREEGQKALITFVTAGDPSLEATEKIVLGLWKAGADVIELGIPYSDPVADGPVIQQASQRALKAGTTVEGILHLAVRLREKTPVPLVLMTYVNPILQYGVERFMKKAVASGINGLIIPDLPMEELILIENAAQEEGMALIPLVAPTSSEERITKICAKGSGFVYCVSLTGVTGIRESLPANINEFLDRVRKCTSLPLGVGFGISKPEQIAALKDQCDGVVVGSSVVSLIAREGTDQDGLNRLHEYVETLKGALK